jgi:hypothetical protein
MKLTPAIDGTYLAKAAGGAASAGQLNTIIFIRANCSRSWSGARTPE